MSAAGAAWESTSKFVIILHAGHNCARRPCALLVRALFISPKLPRAVHPLSRGGMSFRRPRCSAGSAHEWLNSLPAARPTFSAHVEPPEPPTHGGPDLGG